MKSNASSNQFYVNLAQNLKREDRDERLYIRVKKSEKNRIRNHAERSGLTLSEFSLSCVLHMCTKIELAVDEQE